MFTAPDTIRESYRRPWHETLVCRRGSNRDEIRAVNAKPLWLGGSLPHGGTNQDEAN